jgi:hypothetical protein
VQRLSHGGMLNAKLDTQAKEDVLKNDKMQTATVLPPKANNSSTCNIISARMRDLN